MSCRLICTFMHAEVPSKMDNQGNYYCFITDRIQDNQPVLFQQPDVCNPCGDRDHRPDLCGCVF